MSLSSGIFASADNVAFSFPGERAILNGLSLSLERGLAGLVGPNGCGKSTLLRLLAGELRPCAGQIRLHCRAALLPQNLFACGVGTVAEVLGIADVLEALRQISGGCPIPENLALADGNWDLRERAESAFARLGIEHIELSRVFSTLSGGEAVKARLAGLLLVGPDLLLLDEPSNNLDSGGRRALFDFLSSWEGCALVASHDRELLSLAGRILELSSLGLSSFGGNYGFYLGRRKLEDGAAAQDASCARREIKHEKVRRQAQLERQARRMAAGKKKAARGGMPKIIAGGLKRRAQESLGRAKIMHDEIVSRAENRLREARGRIRESNLICVDMPLTEVPGGKVLVRTNALSFSYGSGSRRLFQGGLDFILAGPERVAVSGPNGCGKSTLLRLIGHASGILEFPVGKQEGEVSAGTRRVAYLDQRLSLLDDKLTLLQNISRFAPEMTESEKRLRLARFLFREELVFRFAGILSGGQRLHAALACVLSSPLPPLLLLLDEPTSNLDLDSIERLESALRNFKGAVMAVSHDERFLKNIGITRRVELGGR